MLRRLRVMEPTIIACIMYYVLYMYMLFLLIFPDISGIGKRKKKQKIKRNLKNTICAALTWEKQRKCNADCTGKKNIWKNRLS